MIGSISVQDPSANFWFLSLGSGDKERVSGESLQCALSGEAEKRGMPALSEISVNICGKDDPWS